MMTVNDIGRAKGLCNVSTLGRFHSLCITALVASSAKMTICSDFNSSAENASEHSLPTCQSSIHVALLCFLYIQDVVITTVLHISAVQDSSHGEVMMMPAAALRHTTAFQKYAAMGVSAGRGMTTHAVEARPTTQGVRCVAMGQSCGKALIMNAVAKRGITQTQRCAAVAGLCGKD